MLVGMGTPNVSLPLSAAACREVDLIGVFRYVPAFFFFSPICRRPNCVISPDLMPPINRYANTYPAALALLSSGALEGVEKMITHRFSLSETDRAFEVMKKGVDEKGRLVVKVCVEAT
jgi:L-iditol 2-dehydrogenase